MASKGRKSYDELLRDVFEYINTIEDKPLNIYIDQIRNALKTMPKDIGLQNSYGSTQIENAISNFDIKTTEKYIADTISPYLEQRKQAIREGVKQQLISQSKIEGMTLNKTVSQLTQKEIQKVFTKSKNNVDKKIIEDLKMADPSLTAYHFVRNQLKELYPENSSVDLYNKAIEQLALSFKGKSSANIDTMLKQAGLSSSQWANIQAKVKQLQEQSGKHLVSNEITRILRGQIEQYQVASRNQPYIDYYKKNNISSYLKRTGYGAFLANDKSIIPGGTSIGIESATLNKYMLDKIGKEQWSYADLNKVYEQILSQLPQHYTKGSTTQSQQYTNLLREKAFIEKEFETAINNTADKDLLMELLPKKISGTSGGLLGEKLAQSYAKDPWYSEWLDETKNIKTDRINTSAKVLSDTYSEEAENLRIAQDKLSQNKILLKEMVSEQGALTELTKTILNPKSSKNDRILAQDTAKTYISSLVDSFGKEASQTDIRGELIKNVDSVLATLGNDPQIINRATQLKKMYGSLVPGRGRSFISNSEALIQDANALSNILEYANAYKYQQVETAKGQAKIDKKEFNQDYLKSYIVKNMPDEITQERLQESSEARRRYDEVLASGGSVNDAISRALGAITGKFGERISLTWNEASEQSELIESTDKNGIKTFLESPSGKQRFADLVQEQLTKGVKSSNVVKDKRDQGTHISKDEWGKLSPAGRRLVSSMRAFDTEDILEYYGTTTPYVDVEAQRAAWEEKQAQALSEKVKRDTERTKKAFENNQTKPKKTKPLVTEQPPIVTEPTQPLVTQPDNINQLGDINALATVLGQFVQAVEQSTAALTAHTSATKTDTEAEQVATTTEEQIVNNSKVALEKLDIFQSDNFAQDHTYYDVDGNRVMSVTQLRDTLLGKRNPTLAKDIQTVKNMASQLGDGEILTADMVGAKAGDFDFLKNIIGSGLKGDIFHEITDGIFKWNASHSDDMISSLEELKGRDDSTYNALTDKFNKTRTELAKYGYGDDYLTTHFDIAAYMQAIQKMGLTPTGFSEKALGFTLSGAQGAFKVAVTPDQLYSGALGPVLMDNKTGAVKGFESFQLMAQLLGLKANSDLPELEGLDLDKTELTINDVKNGFSQILKYSELTKEQFYDLLVRAQKILDGTASPLDKEEVAKYSTQQKTGIITGGTKQEYVNPVEQNALMSQVVKNQKAKNQVTEQIDLLTKKANDPSRLKAETQSYLEQIKLLQQKLALLEKTQFVLNQEGNLVKLVNGEEVKNISLNEQQQIQLKEQLALLENQHKTVMAKNAGYTNKNQRGFFGAVFGQIKQTFEYLTRTSIVYGVIGKIQSTFSTLIQTVQSLDKAMVDLQIATNTTRSELQEATKDYNSIATEMGRTTQEVMTAANDWLRAGYKTKEANELIRDSMKLSTLGMIDSAKATEYLISTMKGWKLQAEEVSGVVDDLTALDMEFATSAGDIAQAMAKANVSASLAGVDRKTYESMLTAVMDVGQQGADVVGTAFKTLFARYGNVKSGKYANNYSLADSDSESSEETTKLNDVETVLNKVNIKTRDTVGQFRDMDDVLTEIASKWNSMDQVTQNAVTTALGGTRQREVVNTLFENWSSVEKAKKITEQSEGSSDEKMEYYKDSVEASRNRLTAALEKLVSGQGIEKVLINVNNTLTDLVNNLGTVAILLSSLIIYANREKLGNKLVGATGKIFGGYVGLGNFFSNPFSHVGNFGTNIKNNIISSIETTRLEQFDVQLGKIIGTLQVTDKNIGELGQDALISGQLIVKGLGIKGNTKLGSMSVDSRLNAVNLATQYSPEALNYALYNKLGLVGGDDQGNLNIIMKELGLSEEEAKIKLQEFKTAVEQADIATKKNAETEDLESQKNIEAAQTEELEMASNLQQSNGGQLTKGQGTVIGGIVGSDEYGKNTKGLSVGGKATLGYGVGMIGSTIGTGVAMANSEKMGATGSMALSMGTSLAPMIGSAIGMALGGPAGGAIGSAVGGLLSIAAGAIIPYIVSQKKTTEQILEESKKATEELSDLKDDLNNRKENLTNLEDNEVRFAELIKGVDNTTGKNVSLSDSEWSEYQDILSTIIDSRDDLYASYDAEGNIVAKNADGVAKLNKIMSDSIDITERQIRQKNWEIANNKDDEGNYNIAGQISDATAKEYGNIDKTIGKLSDNFDINTITGSVGGFRGSNDNIWEKYNLLDYRNNNTSNMDVDDAFNKLLKAGASVEELYEVFKGNLNLRADGTPINKEITEEEFATKYSPIISNYNEAKENTQRAYTNGLKSALKTNFQGNENFNALTDAEQNYLSEVVFSNIQANPYKNNDESQGVKDLETTSKAYERYKALSEEAVKWGQFNSDKLAFLSSYDESKTTFVDDETRKKYLFEMFQGQDAGAVASVLKGMGYTNVSEVLGQDKDGNWIWKEDSFDKLKSKREKDQSVLQGLGFNNDLLNQLSTEQLNTLYENRDEEYLKSITDLKKLKQELNKLILGENATLSEYFADFANQTNTSLSDIEGLKEALANPENQDLFSLKKLKESFKELGYDVENTDALAEALTKHISTLGSIDANGYTSKSLSEIESQFEDIDSIVSDLVDNGKLSVENMQKLLEEFPEMIKYLGEGKDLLEAMEELQKDQAELQFASIKNTIAENEENYTEFLSTLEKEGKINDTLKDYLGMFGNSKNLVSLFNQMYQENEDGNYTLKSRYQDMDVMDQTDFSKDSWEKIVGKYIFGVDTTTGTKEDISRKISDAVQAQADKLGLEGSTNDFINIYRNMMTNNPEFINAFQQVADLENQLAAAKASQQLENAQWEEKVSKEISKLKDAFDAGEVSMDDYIKGLQEIRRWSNLTEEQIRELDEAIEDAKFDKLSDQFEKGQISVKNYREELSKLMKNNALGSDDYNKFLEAYLGTYDTEISKLENQKSLLDDSDIQGQANNLFEQRAILQEKLLVLEAAERKNSEEYLKVQNDLKNNLEEMISLYDKGISILENQKSLIDESDIQAQNNNLLQQRVILKNKLIALDAKGEKNSEEYLKTQNDLKNNLEEIISLYDKGISTVQSKRELLSDKDFDSRRKSLREEESILLQKINKLEEEGMKNTEEHTETLKELKGVRVDILEIDKEELEYQKEQLETTMGAYTTLVEYRINQLQKEKSLMEERYDEEIDKLKEVNDQKQRSIELEKYQQELENAKKERSRIYIAGIGWTYQANQAKVDEAQNNLDNYLENRKVTDLENSKNRESKYYQKQIDFWNEVTEKINDVEKVASAQEAVKQLVRDGVISPGSTINTALDDIEKGVTVDVDGHVVDLGAKFNSFRDRYDVVYAELKEWQANYQSIVDNISTQVTNRDGTLIGETANNTGNISTNTDSIVTSIGGINGLTTDIKNWLSNGYNNSKEAIEDIKNTISSGISTLTTSMPKQSTINWDERIGDIQTKLQNAQNSLKNLSSIAILEFKARTTQTDGTWGGIFGNKYSNKYTGGKHTPIVGGTTYYAFKNSESGNIWWTPQYGDAGSIVEEGTKYFSWDDITKGFSSGIEAGMISRTGLYKLHGTPNNPEFVLNSKQAYQLLRNISTLSIPAFESKTSTNKTINYQFYGDMNLPNVKDPSTFFGELLREADGKFNVTKLEY